jgi:hypothetical protein
MVKDSSSGAATPHYLKPLVTKKTSKPRGLND